MQQRAARLGVSLDADQYERLHAYAALVIHWGARINLTGAADVATFLNRYVMGALALAPHLSLTPQSRWADVGSGAGLPGIPLAIVAPDSHWLLLEPRGKRWAFLVQAVHELGLSQVTPLQERLEYAGVAPESLDGVVCRALGPEILQTESWLKPGGVIGTHGEADKGRWPEATVPPGLSAEAPIELALEPPQHLVLFRRQG